MWTVICTMTVSSGGMLSAVMNGPYFIKGRTCTDYRPMSDYDGDQPVPLCVSNSLCCRNPVTTFPFLLLPKYASAIYEGQFLHIFVQGTYFRNILYKHL